MELGVLVGKPARDVPASRAHEYIAGYLCTIDLTARNWQAKAKADGLPWAIAKGCDTFLPLSRVIPPEKVPLDPVTGIVDVELYLELNGKERQRGSTKNMIFTIPKLIEHISHHVTLDEWDVVLTGTPEGVGSIKGGDVIRAGIAGLVDMEFTVMEKEAPSYSQ